MRTAHLLLAEDNLGDVLLVRQSLTEHGIEHELHVVENGAQAIDYMLQMGEPGTPYPDLILLDMNLPRIDGPEVLREMRKYPECAETPVIVISSSDTPRDHVRVAGLGVTRYFRKPIDFEQFLELGAVVREVLDGNAT